MRLFLLITLLVCVGCSNDAEEIPPPNLPTVGSVYKFEANFKDSTFTRTDSIARGPISFEGKRYVFQVGDDFFHPTMYAYASNGNIGRYRSLSTSWSELNFGTKEPKRYLDSVFRGDDWVIDEGRYDYRDTTLEFDGQLFAGVKEQLSWSQRIVRPDGTVSESVGGIEYDVWIPSISYYGLMVSDPETPDEYIAKLVSFARK